MLKEESTHQSMPPHSQLCFCQEWSVGSQDYMAVWLEAPNRGAAVQRLEGQGNKEGANCHVARTYSLSCCLQKLSSVPVDRVLSC